VAHTARSKIDATKLRSKLISGFRQRFHGFVEDNCPSPKLRKTMILSRVTMLPASLHAIHFKHILNFGEGQAYLPEALMPPPIRTVCEDPCREVWQEQTFSGGRETWPRARLDTVAAESDS